MNVFRVFLLLTATLSAFSVSGAPRFRKPLPIDIGEVRVGGAGPLVSADFNGDGFPDVAMTHADGRLAIAMNDGVGPFAATRVTAAPVGIIAMAAGDLDGDGDDDLVYTIELTLGTLLGNGDGTFTPGAEIASAGGLLALGDFNADGELDAVAANNDPRIPSTLSLHFGNGLGGFGAGLTTSIPEAATAIAVAKFDGDAMDDILIASLGTTRTWLARPAGALQPAATVEGGVAAVASRFDANASPDIAIVHVVARVATLILHSGNGDGSFTPLATYPLPEDGPLVCADVDGDTFNDLVTTSAVLTFFGGLGTGAFADPQFSPITPDSQLVVGDFDRDGSEDLVTLRANPALLELVKGDGDGTFGADRMFVAHAPPLLDDEAAGAVIDMNGDLDPDVVVLVGQIDLTRAIAVLRNDGSGALLPPTSTPTGMLLVDPAALVVGLVNGDSYPDVVVLGMEAGVQKATTFLGSADGTLTRGASVAAVFPDVAPTPRLADVTGDGALDLLVDWSLYVGDGNGTFAAGVARTLTFHVVADFDGDNARDVVGLENVAVPILSIARNTGGGNFAAPVAFGVGDDLPYAVGDFNGDDELDVFCMTATFQALAKNGEKPNTFATRVYPGRGDGTFDAPVEVSVPLYAAGHEVTTIDFDGDGNLDVVFSSTVLLGNGAGRFRAMEIGSLGFEASGVGDFDGNGTPDLCSLGDLVTLRLTGLVPEPLHDSVSTLTTEPATIAYPAPVIATARTAGNLVPVTGWMTYSLDGAPIAIQSILAAAAVTPATASQSVLSRSLPPGTYTLGVTYDGDQTYRSSSASLSQTIERGVTSMTASGSGTYGSDATVTVTINAAINGSMPGPDLSKLSILESGAPLAGVSWTGVVAKVRGLNAGTHALTIDFAGDPNYQSSTENLSLLIAKRTPGITATFTPTGSNRVEGPIAASISFSAGVYGATTGTVSVTYETRPTASATIAGDHAVITVNLPAAGYNVLVEYAGDANNLAGSSQSFILVYNTPGNAISLGATANAGTVDIRWTPMLNATGYTVYRRLSWAAAWQVLLSTTASAPFTTDTLAANTTRMYAVVPVYVGPDGPMSAPDLATNVAFTDAILLGMRVKAVHITELRTAVNAVRAFAGLAAFSFTNTIASGGLIRTVHLTELRTALSQARSAIAMPIAFTDPSVTAGQKIRAVHFEELRSGVR